MKKIELTILIFALPVILSAQKPIAAHPGNPHYFIWKGEPVVLVTSAEHYGSIINLDFDFEKYLETLDRIGLNHTRVFLGDYVELPGDFCIVTNPLSPAPGRFITPWMRSNETGFPAGGNKFDLDRWNEDYFKRAHEFMKLAREKEVVVEMVLFFIGFRWNTAPMNPANNVNNTTDIADKQYLTLNNGNILDYQEKYVRKIINEFNRYDNLIINIINEPWFINSAYPGFSAPPSEETKSWIGQVSDWIVDEESKLPNRHLLSIDYCNLGKPISEKDLETVFNNITVFNHHYDRDALSLELNYHLDRILTFNETGLMPASSDEYRIQGWRYMLSGGALYNNLDFTYQVGAEDGSGTTEFNCGFYNGCTDPDIKHQMRVLLDFMNSIDFVSMKPSPESLAVYFGDQDICCLANPGKQYAYYMAGGKPSDLNLIIEGGTYLLTWIRPEDGQIIQSKDIVVEGNSLHLFKPGYKTDLALKIIRKDN